MATQTIHGKLAVQPATASGEVVIKSQLDAEVAAAKLRVNHSGSQTMSTISDAQSYVDGRIQLVVNAAPAALDTLKELADALGNDPNFSATLTTQINGLSSRITTLEGQTGAGRYKTTIGDATASSFTITHGLNAATAADVTVEVVQLSNGQTVLPVITRPSVNTVVVDFGTFVPTNASHRVLVRVV